MKRRGFLKLFGKVTAAVATVPVVGIAIAKKPIKASYDGFTDPDNKAGFGLAQVKAEGSTDKQLPPRYTHKTYSNGFTVNKGIMTEGSSAKPLLTEKALEDLVNGIWNG
jgi:hypothetical protein